MTATTSPAGRDAQAAPGSTAGPGDVRRLRPGVAVTPLVAGLHLRGRRGSVTLEGSTALPALWELVEEPLREGGLDTLLDGMEPGSALRAAVETLVAQLDAHDLLVAEPPQRAVHPDRAVYPDRGEQAVRAGQEGRAGRAGQPVHAEERQPLGGGPRAGHAEGAARVSRWLRATAERPALAAVALATARAGVVSGDPDGPLARAAGRALALGGLPVAYAADPSLPEGRVLLYLHGGGPDRGVAAGLCGGAGYATAPGSPAQIGSEAAALEARLGPGPPAGPPAFVSLLAGAAAHRLLCAAAGLPDPAGEGDDGRLLPGLPAVLLAESRPLRADYRTWLGPVRLDTDRRADLAPADTLGEALRRVGALGDERCGVWPEPLPADLRQLPVPLATCELPQPPEGSGSRRRLVGGAPRLDLARLEVFCRAAELRLGGAGFTVGANPAHARGRALREAAATSVPSASRTPVAARRWSGHPQVRHWWTTLTTRLGVPARLEVFRTVPGEEVYHAVVRPTAPYASGQGHGHEEGQGYRHRPPGAGRPSASAAPPAPSAPPGPSAPSASSVPPVLGEAVEATPGDAAAFAALAAVASVAAGGAGSVAGPPLRRTRPSGGAVAPLAAAGARTAAWEDRGWTGRWLADLAVREEAFQDALGRLIRPAPRTAVPVPAGTRGLVAHLEAFGFTVLPTGREAP
ncbi:hypothetical protein AMK16_20330 [Streptomyces sp. CB00455]|uniref:hypothetical protein n=1 Tax=Streptomyces sp. CB00455 TaxID=1703927 RepID=UPI00093D5D4E|nr:hypothetical protein [Streptomyces sp. CB00455]OKK17238.1 hypothetical protein AMK16_20330 [Streptomyces sp. CB00455]